MTDKPSIPSESDVPKEVVFPQGIPGFEALTRYRVYHSDTESGRVYWMESCDAPEVRFTLVDPTFYALTYVLELTDDEQSLLDAESPDDVIVLLMLWKPETAGEPGAPGLHANISAPILINAEKRLGMQKLIPSPRMGVSISN